MSEIIVSICEDSKEDANLLVHYLQTAGHDLGITLCINVYPDGKAFLKHLHHAVELVFLDVHLPDMSGGEVAAEIRRRDQQVYMVFVSQYTETIAIGYEYEAKNYLLKPLSYEALLKELKRFMNYENTISKPYILLNYKGNSMKLYHSKIRYIETERRKLLIHYDGQVIPHTGKLSDFEQKLPEQFFYRSCNSHLLNLQYVSSLLPDISRYTIQLITGEKIPLSRDRKNSFLHQLQKSGEYL